MPIYQFRTLNCSTAARSTIHRSSRCRQSLGRLQVQTFVFNDLILQDISDTLAYCYQFLRSAMMERLVSHLSSTVDKCNQNAETWPQLERVECPDAGTNGLFLGLVQVFAVSHQLLFVV